MAGLQDHPGQQPPQTLSAWLGRTRRDPGEGGCGGGFTKNLDYRMILVGLPGAVMAALCDEVGREGRSSV